jgi:hypothetical protein
MYLLGSLNIDISENQTCEGEAVPRIRYHSS